MFPEFLQFHIAPYIDQFVEWMKIAWAPFFDAFTVLLLSLLLKIEAGLTYIPWWLLIGVIIGVYWWQSRNIAKTIVLGLLFISIGSFGLWEVSMKTLSIVIVSVLVSLVIGVPLGIAMAESDRVSTIVTPILDVMQTMPSFVYLIPALMLFSLGKVPGVVATVIYALPPVVRLTNLGIRQVSEAVQEAAAAFGATRRQMLKEVRLPLAMPSILAGVNQTTMMALAMVVIASMIGAGGLGEKVLIATNRMEVGQGFEAGWAIVVLAIVIDRLTQGIAKRWDIPSVS
ncbi:MAG: ABC transporter permease subunit [Bacillota bacterium]|nr:ABC transporter permease subunit [Bacillota bacterium]